MQADQGRGRRGLIKIQRLIGCRPGELCRMRWDEISRDEAATRRWLEEWVYDVQDRAQYVAKTGLETWKRLQPGDAWAEPVNYGAYR